MTVYVKIFNQNDTHHNYKYQPGLNILVEEFNADPTDLFGPGGFYFTTSASINNFYDLGSYIREITLPIDHPRFQMIRVGNKFRSNMIIIDEKYSLLDIKTYKKFKLNYLLNLNIVDNICLDNDVKSLDQWKKTQENFYYSKMPINNASRLGQFDILNWWLTSGFTLKYSKAAIDLASEAGRIDVLNWWIKSGLKIKYSENAMKLAFLKKNFQVLTWWIESKLILKYSTFIIDSASEKGWVNILNLFLKSGIEFKYTELSIDKCFSVDVLEWWIKSGLKLKYSTTAIDLASKKGRLDILNWWLNSCLELKYSESCIEQAILQKNLEVLNWWLKSKLVLKYNISILEFSNQYPDPVIVDMFNQHGVTMSENVNGKRYYKVTNKTEIHRGFEYQPGLNILTEDFNSDDKKTCVTGGFYFTIIENIPEYYCFGINIREILLPTNDSNFHMVKLPDGTFRSNMIIFGPKYSLIDPNTYKKFNLDPKLNKYMVNALSESGDIENLNMWKNYGMIIPYGERAMDNACRKNKIESLNWWIASGLEIKYSEYSMNNAMECEHYDILKWWLDSKFELKYSKHIAKRMREQNQIIGELFAKYNI